MLTFLPTSSRRRVAPALSRVGARASELEPPARTIYWRASQVLARVLSTVLFELRVSGQRNLPARGGVLIVSNHQSNLDPVLIAVHLARPLNYIAKSELFQNPVGDWLLRKVFNAFPVRLGAGDVAAVKETILRVREGNVLNIYPEGARSPDGEIGPMQRGIGLIVSRAKVPVVPAVIVGAYEAWPIWRPFWRSGNVRIVYGEPMELAHLSPDQITATIDRTLRTMFAQARGRSIGVNGARHVARTDRSICTSR